MKYIFIFILRFYKFFISPLLGKKCRFIPTCSEYFIEVLKNHKILKSLKLIFLRFIKCNPFFHTDIYNPIEKNFNEE